MIPREAISRAVEGGWKPPYEESYANKWEIENDGIWTYDGESLGEWHIWQQIALDPSFWQALGGRLPKIGEDWLLYALRFSTLILTGGSTDEFWDELLNAN